MRVTVLGAGTWGCALARVLCLNGHSVKVWSRFPQEAEQLTKERKHIHLPGMTIPDEVLFLSCPEKAAANTEVYLVVVPSVYVRETISAFVPFLHRDDIIVCASKGIENDTLMTMTEVIRDEIGRASSETFRTAVLSGPTHAEEVAVDMPTLILCASDDIRTAEAVQRLFDGSCIRPYTSTDVKGVEICGALKNVEALAVGIANGLGYGDNTRAALITRGIAEISRLGHAMGCDDATFAGLAGIGDLIVTATSMHSRNNRAGTLIGQGMSPEEAVRKVGMVVEGLNALPAAVKLCEKYHMDMPLIDAVRRIAEDGEDPGNTVRELMARRLRRE